MYMCFWLCLPCSQSSEHDYQNMNDEKIYIGMVGLYSGLVMGGRQSWQQQQLPCREAHTVEAAKFGQAKGYSLLEQGHVTA